MQADSPLERAIAMVTDLRNRCDWDRVQTRETIRPYLVEEAHELDAATAAGDPVAIRDEVADLMLHLAWQLVFGLELGEFTPDEIADDLVAKMERRHPHLFAGGPRQDWESLKAAERHDATRGTPGPAGLLESVPENLPPLLAAWRIQERAAAVGFDWPDTAGPAAKVREELAEVAVALGEPAHQAGIDEEIGDLLFAVINLARKAGVPPDGALRAANDKFRRRFGRIESLARARGIALGDAGLDALDALWHEVKAGE